MQRPAQSADPANSKFPTPAENSPVLPNPKAQPPAKSADPAISKFPTPAGNSLVLPNPKAQPPAKSADPAISKLPTPAGKSPVLSDLQAHPSAQSFYPANKNSLTPSDKASILPDSKVQQLAKSAAPSPTSPKAVDPNLSDHTDAPLVAGTSTSLNLLKVFVLGSSTTTLAGLSSSSSIYTVDSETFTAHPTKFLVAGTTLSAGGSGIMINSTSISLNASGFLIVGTSTIPLPTPTPVVITTRGQVYTINSDGHSAVDGITLSSGDPGTTISGIPLSADSGGFIIGTSTIPLQTPTPTVVTTNGQLFEIEPSGLRAVNGITLSSGDPGTPLNSTALSVGSADFIIDTNTISLTTSTFSIITTDGQAFTIEPNGVIHVDGATLSSGGSGITINGTSMSVNSGGFVLGSDRISLPTANVSASGTPITQFKGVAPKAADFSRLSLLLFGLGIWMAL